MTIKITDGIGPFLERPKEVKPKEANTSGNGSKKVEGENDSSKLKTERPKTGAAETTLDVYADLKTTKDRRIILRMLDSTLNSDTISSEAINSKEEANRLAETIKGMFKNDPLQAKQGQAGKIDNKSLALLLD